MRYTPIPNELFSTNRKRLTALLADNSMAVLPAAEPMPRNGDQYYPYRQHSDFFYLTGIGQAGAMLLLYPDCPNPAFREILFIEAYDIVKATWEGHMLSAEEATQLSGITQVMTTDQFEATLHECMNYAKRIYLNSNEYIKFKPTVESAYHKLAVQLQNQYPLHKFRRLAPHLEQLRTIKQPIEVELITKAGAITGEAFKKILKTIKPGQYEYEVEAGITHSFISNAANGHGFFPIIGSGINACVLHYNANNRQMLSGDLLLIDFGAEYANYTADISRTIPVNGKFTERQKQCYEAVLRVFNAAIPLYTVGNTIDYINQTVWEMMEQEMIGLGLFTQDDIERQSPEAPLYRNYLMHGIAHHLGLDVHDVGSRYTPLQAGMVLSCEPGLYIRDEKIGIRLENDILITESGPVDLTSEIPIEIHEIETLMASGQ
ncbi:MAG: aminopeptidase P N-terminal domain-containing protein [Bacteroidales bacterium]|jgi:Xaa-Pro aminopeptidase|nr:aminopeptidase P N-terminal domain-containing protein [Bacteroidales bacterium]MCK9449031.1 aminopeptidase P N-terminal domain-containing protein [Bacteroidales bacterium]MDD3701640.1 aminopeptidase P N-terminal domain-containing protein [Bacteroidales bacterium]MDY0369443.1 aminopeptidase P N-terminal domain-containing protein [Bacteroidales bacterium]